MPPTPRLPPPLTPIVTTPTPEVTPTPVLPVAESTPAPEPVLPTETPVAPAADVSVGRAGGGLLEPESVLTPVPTVIWPTPTATSRPPARTPRPDLTPILPSAEVHTRACDVGRSRRSSGCGGTCWGVCCHKGIGIALIALLGLLLGNPFGRIAR